MGLRCSYQASKRALEDFETMPYLSSISES